MIPEEIKFECEGRIYSIPNAWRLLSHDQYIQLVKLLDLYAKGKMSVMAVKMNYVCMVMQWTPERIKEDCFPNLYWLTDQVTFIFNIQYPSGSLSQCTREEVELLTKKEPSKLDFPLARYLEKKNDYGYAVDVCWCKQKVQCVYVDGRKYSAYRIDTDFNVVSCTLTSLQYIEARSLIGKEEALPLLAAILYYPGVYDSNGAHRLAVSFSGLDRLTLQAISLNFIAFDNYLLTHTEFSILTKCEKKECGSISTGVLESLYNLSTDGYGDISAVEQMDVIKYLTILRKKLIDAVKAMADAKLPVTEINERTGLPILLINKIIS